MEEFLYGLSVLSGFFAALSTPILIVIGVITSLIAVFTYLWNTNEEFRNNVMIIWGQIQALFQGFLDWLGDVFAQGFDEKFGLFTTILNDFGYYIGEFVNSFLLIFQGILDFLIGVFTGDWEKAFSGLSSIVEGFQGIVDSCLSFVQSIFNNLLTWLANVFLIDWSNYIGSFGNVLNRIFCFYFTNN